MANKQDLWEDFARKNAEFYIMTDQGVDYSTQAGLDHFFGTGECFVEERLCVARPHLASTRRALEIGSGIGRLVFPHARVFDEVCAVDIAPTMLEKLRQGAAKRGLTNIRTFLPAEAWDVPGSIDYAYSFIVFQHIADFDVIASYIKRIGNALVPGEGIAQVQFDTRPRNPWYRVRNMLPDPFLPATQRRGIRRIRRTRNELLQLFRLARLREIGEEGPGSEIHTFLLRKEAD